MSIDWLLICWFFGRKERKSSPREIFPSSFGLCSVDFHFILNGSDRAHFPRLASNMKLKAHDMQICPMHSSTKPFSLSSFKKNFRDSRGCLSLDRFDKFHFISRAEYPSAEMNLSWIYCEIYYNLQTFLLGARREFFFVGFQWDFLFSSWAWGENLLRYSRVSRSSNNLHRELSEFFSKVFFNI